jgi:hypothetical protein
MVRQCTSTPASGIPLPQQGLRTKITKNVYGGFELDQGVAHSEKQIRESKIPKKEDETMITIFTSSFHA